MRMQEAKLQPISNFDEEADYDLIGFVALRADDEVAAELAWKALYDRHIAYLLEVLKREHQTFLDESCLEDLATDTIIKVFDKPDSFKPLPDADIRCQRLHVRAWLGRIALNSLRTELQKYKGLTIIHPDTENEDGNDGWEEVDYEASCQNDNEWVSRNSLWTVSKAWVVEAFYMLSDREQHILRVTLEYEKPDRKHQKLPHAVSAWLADLYNTTPANIRKIRERAKRNVREYLEEKTAKYNKENQKKE